jgi:hypothetical protein
MPWRVTSPMYQPQRFVFDAEHLLAISCRGESASLAGRPLGGRFCRPARMCCTAQGHHITDQPN